MLIASELRVGLAVRIEGALYKVVEVNEEREETTSCLFESDPSRCGERR